jgi:5'-nucleotidase
VNKSTPQRPVIVLTNDDGYGAPGLEAMVEALCGRGTVVVIAPEREQSACSHKFTLGRALRLGRVGEGRFTLDGTPADCVYLGAYGGARVVPRRPDLVVSGLNAGLNLGLDTYYSGTVAGAREAAMRGIPGMAVSAEPGTDLKRAAVVCADLAFRFLDVVRDRPEALVLNVNVPRGGSWAFRRTRLGRRAYGEGVEYRRDPRGREYMWLGGPGGAQDDSTPGTDTHAIHQGEIGVTHLPLVPGDDPSDAIVDEVLSNVQPMNSRDREGSLA